MQIARRGGAKRVESRVGFRPAVLALMARGRAFVALALAFACSEPAPATVTPKTGGGAGTSGGAGAGGAVALGGAGASAGAGALGGPSAAGGASGGGSSGAAGTASAAGSGGATVGPTFVSVAEIMRQNCGALSCHGGGPEGQDTVFVDTTTLYDLLLTKVVTECGGTVLVKPGDPANSALLQLPTWQCGDLVMPKGCIDDPCLTASEMEAIRGWISRGAPR